MKKSDKRIWLLGFLGLLVVLNLILISATPMDDFKNFLAKNNLNFFGDTTPEFVISVLVVLIIIAGVYDILETLAIFQNKTVKFIISIAVGMIAIMLDTPLKIARAGLDIGANLGALGIALEIVVSMVLFIGLVFGNEYLAKFAAKRRGMVEEIKAIKGAGQAGAAIRGLRRIQKQFDKEP